MSLSADELVARARTRIDRVAPEELADVVAAGGLIVDIRPVHQRREDGELPDAVVIDRNVLEWRLQPRGDFSLPIVQDHAQRIVIVCDEGYASSLAAATLTDMGFERAGDLAGGYQAWRAWAGAGQDLSAVDPHAGPSTPLAAV